MNILFIKWFRKTKVTHIRTEQPKVESQIVNSILYNICIHNITGFQKTNDFALLQHKELTRLVKWGCIPQFRKRNLVFSWEASIRSTVQGSELRRSDFEAASGFSIPASCTLVRHHWGWHGFGLTCTLFVIVSLWIFSTNHKNLDNLILTKIETGVKQVL